MTNHPIPVISNPEITTTFRYGGDVILSLRDLLTDVDLSPLFEGWRPKIKTQFLFRSGTIAMLDEDSSNEVHLVVDDIINTDGNVTLHIPAFTDEDDTLLLQNHPQQINYKVLGQSITVAADIDFNTNAILDATISGADNTISNISDTSLLQITDKGKLPDEIVYTDQANDYGDFDQTFRSSKLWLSNPANTFFYQFVGSALTTDIQVLIPLLTSNDELVFSAHEVELFNKTIDAATNTFVDIPRSALVADIIDNSKLADNAVQTENIANLAITDAKINDVDWSKVTGEPSFSLDTHDHDSDYSDIAHHHNASYATLSHNHDTGDITSGTLSTARGGTGKSTFTEHALLKGGTSNAYDEIAIGTEGYVLTVVSGTPAWAEAAGGGGGGASELDDLTDVTITTPADGDILLRQTGTFVNIALSSVNIAWDQLTSIPSNFTPSLHASTHGGGGADEISIDWSQITTGVPSTFTPSAHNHTTSDITSGTFGVTRGGTGKSTMTEDALLVGGASNTLAELTVGTEGYVLTVVSGSPAWAESQGGPISMDDLTDADTTTVTPSLNDVLTWDGTNWIPAAPPGAGGGEANTASNTGSVGVGIFKQKVSTDLQLYKLNSVDNLLTIALDGTDKIDFTVNEGNLSIDWSQLTSIPSTVYAGQLSYSYIIYKEGANYIALNTATNVEEFSSTAAHTTFNNVVNALSSGGAVYIKNGLYVFTDSILTDHDITWIGEDWEKTILRVGHNTNDKQLFRYWAGEESTLLSNHHVINLKIEFNNLNGDDTGETQAPWISSGSKNCSFIHCWVKSHSTPTVSSIALFFDTANNTNNNEGLKVRYCRLEGSCFQQDFLGSGEVYDADISHNEFINLSAQAFGVNAIYNSNISDNLFKNTGNAIGFEGNLCKGNEIANNRLYNTTGIKLAGFNTTDNFSKNNKVHGNIIEAGEGGIEAGNCTEEQIYDNTFIRTEINGIYGCFTRSTIRGNKFIDCNFGNNTTTVNSVSHTDGGIILVNNTTAIATPTGNVLEDNEFIDTGATFTDPVGLGTESGHTGGIVIDTDYVDTQLVNNKFDGLEGDNITDYGTSTSTLEFNGGKLSITSDIENNLLLYSKVSAINSQIGITLDGINDASEQISYGQIDAVIIDDTDATEDAYISIKYPVDGNFAERSYFYANRLGFGPPGTQAEINADSLTAFREYGLPDASGDLIIDTDSRLTDPRTPTSHAASHADGGGDEISIDWSQITTGVPSTFTPSAHNHSATEITSGTLAVGRGGTGKTTFTEHSLLKGGASNAYSEITVGSNDQVLAVVSGTPAWKSLDSERTGKAIASGNGSTTVFNITHGLGATPSYAFVDCSSHTIARTWTVDGTNIVVTFASAPSSGTNNVIIYWRVIA